MIKFGKSLREYGKRLIEFERKRTILYMSKFNNKKVWILICNEKERNVISGIVRSVINSRRDLLSGKFSFERDTFYSINDIDAISFKQFSINSEDFVHFYSSWFYGDEAELESDILFSRTDLQPQDFNVKTPSEFGAQFTGIFRRFNTRFYEILSKSFRD